MTKSLPNALGELGRPKEPMKVLITGGAGFIGARLATRLLNQGHAVRILDNLHPQVHGTNAAPPAWMIDNCDVRVASITDAHAVRDAVREVDTIVHLAAETGPAQSMYEIERYTANNIGGTSVLLQAILEHRDKIRRLVVASSRAIYGEGKYRCFDDGVVYPDPRQDERLLRGRWEPVCPSCGQDVVSIATDEGSLPKPTSIYAVNKLGQEQMFLVTGTAYSIPTISLRYQNVYGPGQSLTNPYIGVLAIFSARIKAQSDIQIYEDGQESRDFVHVDDVVEATLLAILSDRPGAEVYNVGCGQPVSLKAVAEKLAQAMGQSVPIEVSGRYRVGDIRHCYADLTRITRDLHYRPRITLDEGLMDLAHWVQTQESFTNDLDKATSELNKAGLFR